MKSQATCRIQKNIFLCRDINEMADEIKKLLRNEKGYKQEIHYTIENTVRNFIIPAWAAHSRVYFAL